MNLNNFIEFQTIVERAWSTMSEDELKTMELAFEKLYLASGLMNFENYQPLLSGFLRVSRRLISEKKKERS